MNPQVQRAEIKNTVLMTSAQTSYQEAYADIVTTGINNFNVCVVSKDHLAYAQEGETIS